MLVVGLQRLVKRCLILAMNLIRSPAEVLTSPLEGWWVGRS